MIKALIGAVAYIVIRLLIERKRIIRCKNCKWWGKYGCAIKIVDDSDKPKENDFCSFAERRQE